MNQFKNPLVLIKPFKILGRSAPPPDLPHLQPPQDDDPNLIIQERGRVDSYHKLYLNALHFIKYFTKDDVEYSNRYRDVPVFVFGSSMGGVTALYLAIYNRNFGNAIRLDGILTNAPAIHVASTPNFLIRGLLTLVFNLI